MISLFADTTHALTIGILDENCEWIAYEQIATTKTSTLIHPCLEQMLVANNLSKNQIARFMYVAGPGSYTGMRVAEGIAQIFSWQGIATNSFYHYEVPTFIGSSKYGWYANAYKQEYFLYSRDGETENKELIGVRDWDEALETKQTQLFSAEDTAKIIYDSSRIIFPKLIANNIKRELFYFRNIEDEFKRANK